MIDAIPFIMGDAAAATATCSGLANMKTGDDNIVATILNTTSALQDSNFNGVYRFVGR